MKSKLLLFALLLMGVSAGAQTPISVSISDDCSQNGTTTDVRLSSGVENGYTWINMGLSVMWATVNIGATNPEDYGNYYAWGEMSTKSNYSWSTYLWCNGTSSSMTKYCTSSSFGIADYKTTLEPADDIAHINWSGNWRMPTDAEWTELRTQCTWTWTTQNGVNGCRVTAKNGNSIFLPAAGGSGSGSFWITAGNYWSSSLNKDTSLHAYCVCFHSQYTNVVQRQGYYRCYGFTIRPVIP